MSVSARHIDHLVLAVHDLEAAAAFYERLGFQVGKRNRHPWGTENRLIQFESSFLELITTGDDPAAIPPHAPGRFSFGAFVRDYLDRREGCAMFVLDSTDAEADAAAFARKGIGEFEPFFFERAGRLPDGREIRVSFTLAFAVDPELPNASFFVCQQHHPENFWNPAFQVHPNGATGLCSATLTVGEPADHATFLSSFVGATGAKHGDGLAYALQRSGRLLVEPGATGGGFSAFAVAVPDLAAAEDRLRQAGIPFRMAADGILVDEVDAFGARICLQASTAA